LRWKTGNVSAGDDEVVRYATLLTLPLKITYEKGIF